MRLAPAFFVVALACAWSTVPACAGDVLHFEDVFGPCGDGDLTEGPGTATIESVTFVSPEPVSFGVGKDYSNPAGVGNPFDSDSYHFYAYGDGATIRFPGPVLAVRFAAGVFTNQAVWPTFELVAGGEIVETFGANISTLEWVDVSLPDAPTEVVIRYITGSNSCIGIDDLEYTLGPVTEAESATWGRIKSFYRSAR